MPHHSNLSRRSALRLLVGAAILPPVLGALPTQSASAAPEAGSSPLTDALRRIDKPNLSMTKVLTITGRRHRVTFHRATWTGGQTYVRDLEVRHNNGWLPATSQARRFDEQWIVLSGEEGSAADYYASMTNNWVAFDSIRQVGARTVELRSVASGIYDLVVRWNLDGDNPELHWTITAGKAQHYVVGYQSFDTQTVDTVDEVLCGARQHAKVIEDAQALGAWELFAPMSLVERKINTTPVTLGVYTPSEVVAFEHERELGSDGQSFGMSLRNDERSVQPVVFAPQAGRRSLLKAGERRGYAFGVYAHPGALYQAYTDLVHNEYGYTDYRKNVYETSLTQTIYNMIDLLMVEPDADDSTNFVPSFSGWWNRAKGFVDIENDQAVRTPTAGVLLSAYYLTGNDELYHKRARPMIEYQLSRADIGSTPVKGKPVYGNLNNYRIGRIPGDASTLVPLYQQLRGQAAGIHRLAMDSIKQRPNRDARTPMSTPLQAYELTGNPAYLAEAKAEAHRYLRDNILRPYTVNQTEAGFGYHYSKAWTELLVLFELTGEKAFLDASHREAQRFITQTQVRPVPDTTVTVPNQPFIDAQLDRWYDSEVLPDYPRTTVDSERVPAWMVSTSGVTFEQISTFKIGRGNTVNPGGGFTMIPVWAPFLLRLSQYTKDRLLREVAHNLVVGRFTNYPGYYNRQFSAEHMKPHHPLEGPPGVSCIYYHHIPGQLGMAIDYLITEQVTRSAGKIDYPKQFESNYVFFKYYTYGHAPGTFYGDQNVWPYFPPGILRLSNPQLNWVTAVGNNKLYLSITNESPTTEGGLISFSANTAKIDPRRSYPVDIIRDNGSKTRTSLAGGKLPITVSGKGITAIIVHGVDIDVPWQWTPQATDHTGVSYHYEDIDPNSDFGTVRALLLARPNRAGYDAYVQIDTETPAKLFYSVNGGPRKEAPTKVFPFEWTIPVEKSSDTFTYQVVAGTLQSTERTLQLPPSITGVCPPGIDACGELFTAPDTTPGDTIRVHARVRNGTDAVLSGAAVVLTVPSGWTSSPVGEKPNSVPANGVALWQFDVTAPASATPGGVTLTGTANWSGGTATLAPAAVEILAPLKISSLIANPAQLAKAGDETTITVAVLNVGPVPRSGKVQIGVPPGWTTSASTVDYQVPGRGEREYTVTVTAPRTALPGTAHRVSAALDGGPQSAVTIRIAGTDIIVDNADLWPRYAETGFWLPSSLAGWNGTGSRYNEEGRFGGTATWRPEIVTEGTYDVFVWYPTNPETTTAAIYHVHHADGDQEVTVNQQQNANGWNLLGRFRFAKGTDGYVRIEVRNPGFHRVDAARFVPVDAASLRPAIEGLAATPVSGPGATTTLTATVRAKPATPVKGEATVSTPPGWTVSPSSVPVDLAGGASTTVSFTLTAPATATVGTRHQVNLSVAGTTASLAIPIGTADPATVTIVDNEDAGYRDEGGWGPSSLKGHDGSSTRFASGGSGAVATWTPTLSAAGRYQVSVWYPSNETTTKEAYYTVVTDDSQQTVIVDQSINGATWFDLGFFDVEPATAAVQLSALKSGHHRSDAVRFTPVVAAQ